MRIARQVLSSVSTAVLVAAAALLIGTFAPGTASAAGIWEGQVATDSANVRAGPSRNAAVVGRLDAGQPIGVAQWVIGEKVVGSNDVWGRVGQGRYVYSGVLTKQLPSRPPAPPSAPRSDRWIDVNLTQQVATAYKGSTPVYMALVSTGTPGWETPVGTFPITRRAANVTMDSGTLAVAVPVPYRLPNVLWAQYFTRWGHALHSNYWKWDSPFGVPTSHGCVGMKERDAAFFWEFAQVGTPIVVHY